jgi:hypothetical protein
MRGVKTPRIFVLGHRFGAAAPPKSAFVPKIYRD